VLGAHMNETIDVSTSKEKTPARQNTSNQEIYKKIVIITTIIMTTATITSVLSTAVAFYKGKYCFYNKKYQG
jgi:hypothetical protein